MRRALVGDDTGCVTGLSSLGIELPALRRGTGLDVMLGTAETFARQMARDARVLPVPGSSFFSPAELGRCLVRFASCKRMETLEKAAERLRDFFDGRG